MSVETVTANTGPTGVAPLGLEYADEPVIEFFDPATLTPHPLSVEVYGSPDRYADTDLLESIAKHGVMQPAIVDESDQVLVGCTRRYGAEISARPLPGMRRIGLSDIEKRELVVLSNRQRKKSDEVLRREASALLSIEREKADQRRLANLNRGEFPSDAANAADAAGEADTDGQPQGRSRGVVAEKLDISEKKVRRLDTITKAIERAERDGNVELADRLRGVMETDGLNAAEREAKTAESPSGPIGPTRENTGENGQGVCLDPELLARSDRDARDAITAALDALKKLGKAPGWAFLDASALEDAESHVQAIRGILKAARPAFTCEGCDGHGCPDCLAQGVVPRWVHNAANR